MTDRTDGLLLNDSVHPSARGQGGKARGVRFCYSSNDVTVRKRKGEDRKLRKYSSRSSISIPGEMASWLLDRVNDYDLTCLDFVSLDSEDVFALKHRLECDSMARVSTQP